MLEKVPENFKNKYKNAENGTQQSGWPGFIFYKYPG